MLRKIFICVKIFGLMLLMVTFTQGYLDQQFKKPVQRESSLTPSLKTNDNGNNSNSNSNSNRTSNNVDNSHENNTIIPSIISTTTIASATHKRLSPSNGKTVQRHQQNHIVSEILPVTTKKYHKVVNLQLAAINENGTLIKRQEIITTSTPNSLAYNNTEFTSNDNENNNKQVSDTQNDNDGDYHRLSRQSIVQEILTQLFPNGFSDIFRFSYTDESEADAVTEVVRERENRKENEMEADKKVELVVQNEKEKFAKDLSNTKRFNNNSSDITTNKSQPINVVMSSTITRERRRELRPGHTEIIIEEIIPNKRSRRLRHTTIHDFFPVQSNQSTIEAALMESPVLPSLVMDPLNSAKLTSNEDDNESSLGTFNNIQDDCIETKTNSNEDSLIAEDNTLSESETVMRTIYPHRPPESLQYHTSRHHDINIHVIHDVDTIKPDYGDEILRKRKTFFTPATENQNQMNMEINLNTNAAGEDEKKTNDQIELQGSEKTSFVYNRPTKMANTFSQNKKGKPYNYLNRQKSENSHNFQNNENSPSSASAFALNGDKKSDNIVKHTLHNINNELNEKNNIEQQPQQQQQQQQQLPLQESEQAHQILEPAYSDNVFVLDQGSNYPQTYIRFIPLVNNPLEYQQYFGSDIIDNDPSNQYAYFKILEQSAIQQPSIYTYPSNNNFSLVPSYYITFTNESQTPIQTTLQTRTQLQNQGPSTYSIKQGKEQYESKSEEDTETETETENESIKSPTENVHKNVQLNKPNTYTFVEIQKSINIRNKLITEKDGQLIESHETIYPQSKTSTEKKLNENRQAIKSKSLNKSINDPIAYESLSLHPILVPDNEGNDHGQVQQQLPILPLQQIAEKSKETEFQFSGIDSENEYANVKETNAIAVAVSNINEPATLLTPPPLLLPLPLPLQSSLPSSQGQPLQSPLIMQNALGTLLPLIIPVAIPNIYNYLEQPYATQYDTEKAKKTKLNPIENVVQLQHQQQRQLLPIEMEKHIIKPDVEKFNNEKYFKQQPPLALPIKAPIMGQFITTNLNDVYHRRPAINLHNNNSPKVLPWSSRPSITSGAPIASAPSIGRIPTMNNGKITYTKMFRKFIPRMPNSFTLRQQQQKYLEDPRRPIKSIESKTKFTENPYINSPAVLTIHSRLPLTERIPETVPVLISEQDHKVEQEQELEVTQPIENVPLQNVNEDVSTRPEEYFIDYQHDRNGKQLKRSPDLHVEYGFKPPLVPSLEITENGIPLDIIK